jgi:hypothetical protein
MRFVIILLVGVIAVSCSPAPLAATPTFIPTLEPVVITVVVTADPPTLAPTAALPQLAPDQAFIPSEQAAVHIGEVTTVRIEKADCSYLPDVNGSPTFCNDQPYPNHTFTMVVWGQDWSFLNGGCILVTGEIQEFEGKPEIIVESTSQFSLCQ